jgi:hypothetical protein
MEFFGQRDEVNGLLGFAERNHLRKDAAMLIEKEIFGAEILDGGVEGVVVEENGAEDGALGVEVIGERLFESGVHGHKRSLAFAFSSLLYHVLRRRARAELPAARSNYW